MFNQNCFIYKLFDLSASKFTGARYDLLKPFHCHCNLYFFYMIFMFNLLLFHGYYFSVNTVNNLFHFMLFLSINFICKNVLWLSPIPHKGDMG